MRKLFTKYLPDSEGRIVNLDRPDVTLKLFLCSSTIQVGDSYQCFNRGQFINDIATEEIINAINNGNEKNHLFYKILGEVSPAAIVKGIVKEGMEFEEDQIEEWYIALDKVFVPSKWIEELIRRGDIEKANKFSKCIKFKCPTCGTFH